MGLTTGMTLTMNDLIYRFSVWLDSSPWSAQLHESFYMYNWIETTHVLSLMLSLGLLFIIDLRLLGVAFSSVSIKSMVIQLTRPMLIGFTVSMATGLLLFYAIPVRTSQSVWFRFKIFLLVLAAINALFLHYKMNKSDFSLDIEVPHFFKIAAAASLIFWVFIVIFGRLIAYDWFDCARKPIEAIYILAGCIDGQTIF